MKKIFIRFVVMFLVIIGFANANQLSDSFSPIPQPIMQQYTDSTSINQPISDHDEALQHYLKMQATPRLRNTTSNEADVLPHIYMLHINGINTSIEDAKKNMQQIRLN